MYKKQRKLKTISRTDFSQHLRNRFAAVLLSYNQISLQNLDLKNTDSLSSFSNCFPFNRLQFPFAWTRNRNIGPGTLEGQLGPQRPVQSCGCGTRGLLSFGSQGFPHFYREQGSVRLLNQEGINNYSVDIRKTGFILDTKCHTGNLAGS